MMKLCSLLLRARRRLSLLLLPDEAANGESATVTERWATGLFVSLLFLTVLTCPLAYAQGTHIVVGQTGVNPGAGLFTIAVKQGLYKKHGLDVEIIKTATTVAVQAMLAGKMHLATGAGAAAFVTAQLEGAPPFLVIGSWVNVFPYKIMADKDIRKIEDLKGKTGHVGAPFGTIPDTALRFALNRFKIDPERERQTGSALKCRSGKYFDGHAKRRSAVRYSGPAVRSGRRAERLGNTPFPAAVGYPVATKRRDPASFSP